MQTFLFYDLETSGVSPRESRIMQFAGQRTSLQLEPIGKPFNYLIKLTSDVVPEPDAVLLTGITPQKVIAEGLSEAEFLKIFHKDIATKDTIFAGFNTVRFDDEFMRFLNYRNFYDPYEWHWQDGRSRWDLLDVTRMTRALRPEGIKWPFDSSGKASNRLGLLTSVNKLDHENAHDALSDVKASIALAQLIRSKQPKLFDYLLDLRDKKKIQSLVMAGEPFVYTSGKYSAKHEKTTVVASLAEHPTRTGAVLVYDLRHDPTPFLKMNPEELVECWRWKKDRTELQLPVKTLQFNRCPAVAPLAVLDKPSQQRLNLDMSVLQKHIEILRKDKDFTQKLFSAVDMMNAQQQARLLEDEGEVDTRLYDGFFDNRDKSAMSVVRAAKPDELRNLEVEFEDQRLSALLPLYKARNFPQTLSPSEQELWQKFRERKLYGGKENSRLARFFVRLSELKERKDLTGEQRYILEELELYGQSLMPDL